MRLQEIEDEIARLERGECEAFDEEYGTRLLTPRPPTPTDICRALYELEGTLRQTAWAGPYQARARELIDRADREVRRLCEMHSLLYGGRTPLVQGGVDSNGIRYNTIP